MFRTPITASILGLALLTVGAGCRSSEPESPQTHMAAGHMPAAAHEGHDMDMSAGERQRPDFAHKGLVILDKVPEVPQAFTSALGVAVDDYYGIAQAFASDDSAAATSAAKAMLARVEAIDDAGLGTDAAAAWKSHREVLRASLHQLMEAEGIAGKRQHFSHASEAMYCAVRSFGGVSGAVEVAHCPMAFGDVGAYWLPRDKTIANPYLGKSMPTCGTIEETLAAR